MSTVRYYKLYQERTWEELGAYVSERLLEPGEVIGNGKERYHVTRVGVVRHIGTFGPYYELWVLPLGQQATAPPLETPTLPASPPSVPQGS
ncbi:MAG: hypothetical protein HYX97_04370 [Chloroflexi bacterium]|nr:hypothetical protein [Chloroflexota bacterium]